MLADVDRQIALQLKKRLEAFLPDVQMSVYGSRARGDASRESDLDVFITLNVVTPEMRTTISEIAWELGLEHNTVISTFVATRDQLEYGALGASPLVHAVEEEGVPV